MGNLGGTRDPHKTGSLNVSPLFVSQLPINFSGAGEAVSLEMVGTYAADDTFVSAGPVLTPPAEVDSCYPSRRSICNMAPL
jgi:hypothetical protein